MVYGEKNNYFYEDEPVNPIDPYARMKCEIESRFSLENAFKSVRLSYVFSRSDKFTSYLISQANQGNISEIYHPLYRSIVHLDDVALGSIKLALAWEEFPQNVFNFAGPEVLSRVEFVEILKSIAAPNLKFSVIEPPSSFYTNRPRAIHMRSELFSDLLGRPPRFFKDAVSLEFKGTKNE
jgi:dTDP-4-dehydrorhamnose reductase